jgi:hypothetical protein
VTGGNTEVQRIHFRYQLSYLTLFEWTRRLQIQAYRITDPPMMPLPQLIDGADGILVRSMPLAAPLPTISTLCIDDRPLLRYVMQRFPRYFIEMTGQSFDGYKAKFSAKTRSTLSRKLKRFTEHCGGKLEWAGYRTPESLDRFWRDARELSKKTYQEKLLDAGLPDTPEYLEQAKKLAAQDAFRAFLLFDRGRAVSYLVCPIRDGVVEYGYLGYDPEYRGFSVGTLLQWVALESLFAERRYRFFDFTEGESEHKRLFSTGHLDCANVVMLRISVANRVLAASHEAFTRLAEGVGRWLERHQMKSRLRSWIRRLPGGRAPTA